MGRISNFWVGFSWLDISSQVSSTSATTEWGGPVLMDSKNSSRGLVAPRAVISTVSSERLRTQPERARFSASWTVKARKPTPWTAPLTRRWSFFKGGG